MVKTFDPTYELPTEISGSLIKGKINEFSSTGITDLSTKQTLVVEDDKITVKTASIETLTNDLVVRGDVKVYGILDAGFVRTTEIITNQRYEKQFLEFASPLGETGGTGLIWRGARNRSLSFMLNPDRFWLTENVDIPEDKSYLINGTPALSRDSLGTEIAKSHLRKVGVLEDLTVAGQVNIGDHIHYNPVSQRLSLGTDAGNALFSVYDYNNNVEVIVDSNENGHGVIGTHSTRSLDIVTDHQTRITISETGNVTIGHEYRDNTVTKVYGKLSVGVNNPTEAFEVAGNMRIGNRLFANGNGAPTSGSFQKGDIVWNLAPKPGSYIGWVCTQGGAPGVWNPFGKIES